MKTSTYAILIFICFALIISIGFVSVSYGTDSDVLITWEQPLLNTNGTVCVDYAGVKIFQRINNEEYNYDNPIAIVYRDSYWIKSDFIESNEYHWVLQSFDTSNNHCLGYTEEVSKIISITLPNLPKKLTLLQ